MADDVQRIGAGSALLGQLTRVARRAGIRRFLCEVLAENSGMRALAKRMGGLSRWQGDGTVDYEWPLRGGPLLDDLFWSADSREELGESVQLWLRVVEQVMSIGIDHYDAMLRRIADTRSFDDSPYLFRWAH